MSNSQMLKTVGFPRSGNTYVNYAFKHAYHPEQRPNVFWHTVAKLDAYPKVFVPFRNPVDCIASWNLINKSESLIMDIKHYLRFHNAVLSKNHAVLLDFDHFTEDLTYLYQIIKKELNIDPIEHPTDEFIKQSMLKNNWGWNLPRNNQKDLDIVKNDLMDMPEFQACLDLYDQLKSVS